MGDTCPNHNGNSISKKPYIVLYRYLGPFGRIGAAFGLLALVMVWKFTVEVVFGYETSKFNLYSRP